MILMYFTMFTMYLEWKEKWVSIYKSNVCRQRCLLKPKYSFRYKITSLNLKLKKIFYMSFPRHRCCQLTLSSYPDLPQMYVLPIDMDSVPLMTNSGFVPAPPLRTLLLRLFFLKGGLEKVKFSSKRYCCPSSWLKAGTRQVSAKNCPKRPPLSATQTWTNCHPEPPICQFTLFQ